MTAKGAYVAAAFSCVEQMDCECMDTESLLAIGMDGTAAFELIGADPGSFSSKLNLRRAAILPTQ